MLSVDGLTDLSQLHRHLSQTKAEEWVVIRIRRNGEDQTVKVPGRTVGINVKLPPR